MILAGDKVLSTCAFPGFALAELGENHPDGQIAFGLIFTVLGWPITIPAMLILGPVHLYYQHSFDVAGALEREAERQREARSARFRQRNSL